MEISCAIIPHKLVWVSSKEIPRGRVVNSDTTFTYDSIYSDFGPIDLGQTFAFCKTIETMLKEEGEVTHYCSQLAQNRSNAAYLMGAFQIICLKKTAEMAWRPFQQLPVPFLTFRDASSGACSYKCSVLHCLNAIYKAVELEWFNYESFDMSHYNHYSQYDNGDLTWIIPGKLLAFSSPSLQPRDDEGFRTFTPEDYVPHFLKFGVKTVIKLDGTNYDPSRFIRNRITHIDLSFKRLNLPPLSLILKFIETVEETQGPIAIHCKTGLSKTGTLIGLYAMKNFDITAQEYIAWSRICRPGSVIGSQQEFLLEMEAKCKAMKKKEVILAQTPKTHRELKRKQTVISKNKGMTFTSLASNASLHKKNSYSNIPPRWQTATPTTPVNFKRSQTPIASPFSYASVFSQYLSKINLNYNVN